MSTANSRSNLVPLTRSDQNPRTRATSEDSPRRAPVRIVSFDEEPMTTETTPAAAPAAAAAVRDIPIDWEALEDAFENNAPEVHSYLHLVTGDVLRVVDGVADPQMHARIAADTNYLRIDPVSSREQYRWMERYIPMVEDPELQAKLNQAIDGKGAFRRFKDVLMTYAPERERWFAFRSERLRIFMEAWLSAHALNPVPRPVWVPEVTPRPEGAAETEHLPVEAPAAPPPRRGKSVETLRKNLREIAEALGPRDLDTLTAFAEFLKARRAARSFSHHLHEAPHAEEEAPASQEIAANEARSEPA